MTDAETLARLKTALRGATCAGPVAPEVIAQAEQVLGVQFPRSYRVFLENFGACYGEALCEVAGLTSEEFKEESRTQTPEWSSVVLNTQRERALSRATLPESYIPVSDDGMDCTFYLDTSNTDDLGECPVIAVGPAHSQEVRANSFLEFVASEA
jgi:hypothetical protein